MNNENLQPGFGNMFSTEALADALPIGRNSPQRVPYGLYAELVSGTAFTAPRHENRRTWTYRIAPSASQTRAELYPHLGFGDGPSLGIVPPDRLRWSPPAGPKADCDFVDGLVAWAKNGDAASSVGVTVLFYHATRSMTGRAMMDADGELLIIPQSGDMQLTTELGRLWVRPGEVALVPRGLRFRVEVAGPSRGYVCENLGRPFCLPELGPIGSNGLANARDFLSPVAWFEDIVGPYELVQKFQGQLWRSELAHSPFDVVAWHGNLAPWKYDLARFNAINTVSFDHPDPSIFTVLTSPSDVPGTANADFVVFPPRWAVAEQTFRPPWFHRNVMSEFMGLIEGRYDAKASGFEPGGASLHNCMSAHGPDRETYDRAIAAALQPEKLAGGTAFMVESRWVLHPTAAALASPSLQPHYDQCWEGFARADLTQK